MIKNNPLTTKDKLTETLNDLKKSNEVNNQIVHNMFPSSFRIDF